MSKVNLEVFQCDACGEIERVEKASYYTLIGMVSYTEPEYQGGRLRGPRAVVLAGNGRVDAVKESHYCVPCFRKKILGPAED